MKGLKGLREAVKREIIRLRAEYKRQHGLTPQTINNGSCDSFAQDLLTKFPLGDTFWGEDYPSKFEPYIKLKDIESVGGHCFFYIDGYYYDSECPNGVENPALLPFYQKRIELRKG